MTTTYEDVKFQKSDGKIVLSSSDLSFQAGKKTLQLPWTSVAKHQMNPKSQEKALLKMILADNKPAKLFRLKNHQQLQEIYDDIVARLRDCPAQPSPSKPETATSSDTEIATNAETSIVYENVSFRNAKGTLYIMKHKLKFQAAAGGDNVSGSKSFSLEYKEITKQQTSPPKVEKCMLKLMRKHDGKAITLEVLGRAELEKLSKDVQRARKISDSVGKRSRSKSASSKDSRARSKSASSRDARPRSRSASSSRTATKSESKRITTADGTITYTNIQYKTATGSLSLTDEHIAFQASESSKKVSTEKIILAQWDQVSKTQGSPSSHAKVLLKVLLTDAGSLLFQLSNRSTQQGLKDDIAVHIKSNSQAKAEKEAVPGATNDSSGISPDTIIASPQSTASSTSEGVVCNDVKYGNQEGTLTLARESISFRSNASSDDSAMAYFAWKNITKQQCSPAKMPNAELKLVVTDRDEPVVFELASRAELGKIRKIIASKLQSVPRESSSSSPAAELRQVIPNAMNGDANSISTSQDEHVEITPTIEEPALESPAPAEDSHDKNSDAAIIETSPDTPGEPSCKDNIAAMDSEELVESSLPVDPRSAEQESIRDSSKMKASSMLSSASSFDDNDDDSKLLFEDHPVEEKEKEIAEEASNDIPSEDHNTASSADLGYDSEPSLEADTAENYVPGDETPDTQTNEPLTSPAASSTIVDLLEVSSTGSDDGDFYADARKSQTMNDLLASLTAGIANGADVLEGSDSDDDGGIRNLMALTGDRPANSSKEDKPGGGVIHDIFDESFASLMSDTGFSMMDDDSDDDFSVLTLDTINSKTVESTSVTSLPKDYPGIKLKSMKGTVTLCKGHFLFKPDETKHPSAEPTKIEWKDIERHHGSPHNLSKVMLKIILQDGTSIAFRLGGRKELELLRMDMTSRLHECRKTHVSSSVLEGLVIAGSNKKSASKTGYTPNYKRLPTGAKSSSAYHPVHFEQSEGSLFLSWDQFSFQPSGLGDVDKARTVFWDSVAGHDISQEKPALRIELLEGNALVFRFSTRKEVEKCEKDTTGRMSSYKEFEDVSQKQFDSSDKSADDQKDDASNAANAIMIELEEEEEDDDDDIPENNMASLLDISHPTNDDFDDPDDLFAHGLPPPPPPPSGLSRSSSESSMGSSSSSSSSSSGESSTSSNGSESGDSDQDGDGKDSNEDSSPTSGR